MNVGARRTGVAGSAVGSLAGSEGAGSAGVDGVDLTTTPFPVVIHFTVTSGTGALAGATGEIVLTGTSRGPGAVGDVFTITGTLTTPPPVPTDKDQCKDGGWQDLADNQGQPFRNQAQCVSFVEPTPMT